MSLQHWLRLALTDGIGPILSRRLIEAGGGAEGACGLSIPALRNIEGIGQAKADAIHRSLRESARLADAEWERVCEKGATLLCPDDPAYPILLKSIPDPPPVLYMKGTLEPRDLNAVAIVGSRKCSFYGREQAERFAALLAGSAVSVISGGARGIDSAAHRGALSLPHGRTIAVLGCGIDVVYPPENKSLFESIAERGAVLSEYPLGTPPLSDNFPRRNRIVSGLSRGVLVVEASDRSGALITARQACDDHGRPVFVVPGRVDNPLSAGPHKLLRDGAILAARLEDILDNLGPLPQEALEAIGEPQAAAAGPPPEGVTESAPPELFAGKSAPMPSVDFTESQQTILAALDGDPCEVDTIIERTGLAAQKVLQDLTLLSLRGQVNRVDGRKYVRRR